MYKNRNEKLGNKTKPTWDTISRRHQMHFQTGLEKGEWPNRLEIRGKWIPTTNGFTIKSAGRTRTAGKGKIKATLSQIVPMNIRYLCKALAEIQWGKTGLYLKVWTRLKYFTLFGKGSYDKIEKCSGPTWLRCDSKRVNLAHLRWKTLSDSDRETERPLYHDEEQYSRLEKISAWQRSFRVCCLR